MNYRKEIIYIIFLAILLCSGVVLWSIHADEIYNKEISLLKLPPNTISSGKEDGHFYFLDSQDQQSVISFLNKEFSKNGWIFIKDVDTIAMTYNRGPKPEYHYWLYTKGKLLLTLGWSPAYSTTYVIKITNN